MNEAQLATKPSGTSMDMVISKFKSKNDVLTDLVSRIESLANRAFGYVTPPSSSAPTDEAPGFLGKLSFLAHESIALNDRLREALTQLEESL